VSNVAACDSLICRSDGGNVSDGMNTKFFPFQSQGGVIQRGSADVHRVVTCLFSWSGEQIIWLVSILWDLIRYQCLSCIYWSGYVEVICVSCSPYFVLHAEMHGGFSVHLCR